MFDKRLLNTVRSSKKYIAGDVVCQWLALLVNILMVFTLGRLLRALFRGGIETTEWVSAVAILASCLILRFLFLYLESKMSYGASKQVKGVLRGMILKKLFRLGTGYSRSVGTAQAVQMASEGVEQLEIYFGKYMPQFFYSLLAPLTLFVVLSFVNLKAAVILLVCVPLIPVSILLVQKLAKKLLSKYWGVYTDLGDSFLENLQGLTTLKIYRADEFKQEEMNRQAERFRKITIDRKSVV